MIVFLSSRVQQLDTVFLSVDGDFGGVGVFYSGIIGIAEFAIDEAQRAARFPNSAVAYRRDNGECQRASLSCSRAVRARKEIAKSPASAFVTPRLDMKHLEQASHA